jgi:hypothetical protein
LVEQLGMFQNERSRAHIPTLEETSNHA